MMTSASILDRLLTLTQEMLTQSQAEEWERVNELQQDRLQLMGKHFSLDDSVDTSSAEGYLKQILSLEEEIKILAAKSHQAMRQQLGKIGQGKQATRAYKNISAG